VNQHREVPRPGQLVGRAIRLFLAVERTRCTEADCRCRNHEVLVVRPFGWYALLAWMLFALVGGWYLGGH
jgi:hypothetical protein